MKKSQSLMKLTPYQESFYHEWMLNPLRSDYNLVLDQSMSGVLDIERLNTSLVRFVNNYLLINSNVLNISGELFWKSRSLLSENAPILTYFPQELSKEELLSLALQPFDLEKDQLIRFYVIQLNDGRYRIVYVTSHIIIDGLSADSFYEELGHYYNDPTYVNPVNLVEQACLNKELNDEFAQILKDGQDNMSNFWESELKDLEKIGFKFLQASGTSKDPLAINKISEFRFEFQEDIFLKIKQLKDNYNLTPYTYGQMILAIVLHRISGIGQVGINYPVGIKEGQELIFGAHINTIIKGYHFTSETRISDLIAQNLHYLTELKKTQSHYLPIGQLIKYAQHTDILEFSFAQTSLKDIYINYEGTHHIIINNTLNIDLLGKIIFEQEVKGNQLNYRVKYDTFELDSELVSQFIEIYKRLFVEILDDVLENKGISLISSYDLLNKDDYQVIVHDWNGMLAEYNNEVTIHELFERQVEKTPDHIALVYEDVKLTYRELNERSNQLAHYLLNTYKIKPDELIPLCLDRSEHILIGMLGILKSGGAYVPMDPSYPMDRIEHILEDTGARLLIGEEKTKDRLYEYISLRDREAMSLHIISLNGSEMNTELSKCSHNNPKSKVSSGDLSYVIYTSGTTGKPKGVMIEHKSMVNFVCCMIDSHMLTEYTNVGCYSNYVFDVFVSEAFPVLCHGNTLWLYSNELRKSVKDLNDYIKAHDIEVSFIPPVILRDLLPDTSLQLILVGGEAFPDIRDLDHAHILFINEYGPTETTVWSTYHHYDKDNNALNIGKPIANTTTYVLDEYLRPVPIGAIGELYIGGVGLSRGYLNLPELTEERFLLNPFQSKEDKVRGYNSRIYKTGDLVRFCLGGDIEYIGRNDFQVKIRGYRIELGEIESALLSYEGVRQAVVLAKEHSSGLKYLVGYYVSDTAVDHEDLSMYLSGLLPEYMVPSAYVHLEELPMTLNGKLDRRALPEPSFTGDREYIAPTTALEKQLVEIYGGVLGLPSESIGIHDDFFRLGGNSIMAIKLISKIHHGLGLQANVAMVFSHKTVFGLAGVLKDLESGGSEMISPIAVHSPEEQLLSFAQERLWFIDQYEGGSSAYNIPMIFGLSSKVDLMILEKSFRILLSRHDILRTLIATSSDGVGYQYVSDQEVSIKETDVESSTELEDLVSQEITRVFDLSKELPISVCVFHKKEKNNNEQISYISIVIHHIAFDGWSIDIFLEELRSIYQDLLTNSSVSLPSLRIQYKDFALWQRDYLQGEVLDRQLDYWRTKLSEVEPLNLPLDYTRPSVLSYEGHTIRFDISNTLGEDLRLLSQDLGASLYSVMLGGYYLLLSSYSGQKDIVLGTVVANRHHAGLEDLIGFFVNTLVLREEIDYEVSVRDFILQVSDSVSQAQMHQDVPFEKLVEELGVVQDVSRHPLFQVMFGLQSFGIEAKRMYGADSLFEEFKGNVSYDVAKFDLSVMIDDDGESLFGSFNYARGLFKESTINHMISTYVYLLEQMISHHKERGSKLLLEDLSWIREEDYSGDGIFTDLLDTYSEYDTTVTIHELFERQVERTPDHIALVYENVKLTYRELNERSNRLAHYLLQNHQIQPDELIPLCLERSEQMLVSILGLLKSGGAYVPMDPSYPMDRIEHILKDTKARLVLVEENTKDRLYDYKELIDTPEEHSNLNIISLNSSEMKAELSTCSVDNPQSEVSSGDLSYVIYTSGTTGKPKGVMIEHKGVVNLVEFMISSHRLTDYRNVGCYSNYVFDAFACETFPVLCHGNTLWLYTNEHRKSVKDLNEYITEYGIEVSFIPPVLLKEVLPDTSLALIFAGGESFPEIDRNEYSDIILLNEYGPSESTVCATYHHYHEDGNALNIGQPIANTIIYVLDAYLRPVPIGAVGELYIGGSGLSRGYLNLPELTAERFLKNPFQSEEEKERGYNGRIYKTGDLGRYLPGGDLEYIGRNDFQVKIRGYRIELGEIENSLLSYEGIRQSVVLAKEHSSGLKYLVGYYVSDTPVNHEDLSVYLSGLLPEYMVPSTYVHLESLPLTINGKLDRRALPEPNFTGDKEYIAPTTVLEKQLAEIYGEVLGLPLESISLHDDFFRLGGDSIISIQLVSRLRKRLSLSLSVKEVFTYRTVYHLSELLESRRDEEGISLITEQGILEGEVSLLPIQEWFFHEVELGEHFTSFHHWNQSFMIHVPELDIDILKQSLLQLVDKHDALRLYYPKTEHGYLQEYRKESFFPSLRILDRRGLRDEELVEVFTSWQRGFDIVEGSLFHVGYIHGYEDGSCRVHLCFHHLIIDAVSWRILTEDLQTMYRSLMEGNIKPEYVKGSSYRQWVDVVKRYKQDSPSLREEELTYWNHIIENTKNSSLHIKSLSSSRYHHSDMVLDKDSTSRLLRDIHGVYHTRINDILLSAFSLALCDFTGLSNHGILLEGHGREDIFPGMDITETVGWFTTMYPIVLEKGKDLFSTIVHTKESLRGVPNNGIGYGSLIGYTDGNLPRISFNYLGQLDQQDSVSESWHIVGENSGESVGRYNSDFQRLSINGAVVGGELYFGLRGYFSEEEMNRLSVLFKGYLEQLVNELSGIDRSYLTLSDVDHMMSSSQLDSIQESTEIESVYLASSLQEGFIYHALSQGDVDDSYRVQLLWDYHGVVDLEKLKESWEYVQKKHPVLRTRFDWSESIVQVVDKIGSVDWRCIDLSGYDEKEREDKLKSIVQKDREEEYDLSRSGLFRVYVCQHSDSHYTCIFSNHHAILDGWSMPVLFNDIHRTYLTLWKGEAVASMVDISYGESQKYLQDHKGESDSFWNEYMLLLEDREDLSSLLKVSEKHTNLSNYRHIQDHQSLAWNINQERYLSLKNLISKEGLTVNAVLQYLWHKQLSIYSNQRTTVVGTTVSGRSLPVEGIESSVGLYINTLPLIVEHKEGKVMDLIVNLQSCVSDLNTYNDKSLSGLQDNGERLFSSLFVYENYPISDGGVSEDLDIRFRDSIEKVDYPLSLIAYERGEEVSLTLNYEGFLFEGGMMSQVLEGMELMLDQLLQDPTITTDKLSYVSALQYQDLIQNWNDTTVGYDTHVTLHELFERQVERTPDHIALVYEDVKLTYRELNERSNQLAHYLLQHYQISPDELIPLCLERSEQMLIAILGVLKSGGAYVPMDPSYPMDRIEHILRDTKARLVLVEENTKDRLYDYRKLIETEAESSNLSIISLDSSDMEDSLSTCSTANPNTEVSSEDLSYVIYTSGTTGKPKGVMIEHKSVVRLFSATDHWYGFTDKDVWSLFHSYVFDVSVWEMWGALLHGGKLLIPSVEQTKDLYLFFDLCYKNNLTVLCKTPTAFYQFIEVALSKDVELSDLRYVIFAGEALNFASLEPWYGRYSEVPLLINMYGTTETTVHASYRELDSGELGNSSMVGKSIPDQRIYVLDGYLCPVPIGAIGELYIGGSGLSRGYLNLPELTEERFLLNPFQSEEEKERDYNGRMYKTGDLGRYLPGGDLEYIGRNDFQVKIRGYRIELGEIENGLLSYEGIRQSIVLAKENSLGLKYLVGYYVSDTSVNNEDLSVHLSGLLPEYMVPSTYVHLEEFPLTINGKLDRKALPEPNFTGDREYIAPTTTLEKELAEIYGEVLGLPIENIGIHDDFFRLGGNSIMAIKLISKIHQRLGLQASVAMVLSHKTIFGLAGALKDLDLEGGEMIRPIGVHSPEEQLLSFAQERLWFIDQYEGGSSAYNIPMVFGLSKDIDMRVLGESFRVLLSRHEILRTLIVTSSEGVGYQYVSDQELGIKENDGESSTELEELISQEITRVFDLSKELPISVCVFHKKEKNSNNEQISYISIVIHHIAFDGWSIDIFLEELGIIYRDLLSNRPVSLPSLRIQYKDFALWQRDYLQGEVLEKQLDYWKTKLSEVEPLNLPLDYTRPSVLSYEGNTIRFDISNTLGEELRLLSQDLGVSLYSVMLGGYYLLLSSYSGQNDIVLGTVVANRHHAGLENLIGFFVNTLVLREEIDYGVSVRDFILQVSDSVSQAQMNQDVPFEKLVEELGVVHDVSRHPIFQVMFGLQSFGREAKRMYGEDSLFQEFKGNISYDVSKFDLTVIIDDGDESLSGSFNYARGLFKESTINHMISTYVYLLEQMIFHHKEIKLQNLSWVRKEDYKEGGIFSNLLGSYSEYDTMVTIHELFERQVEKTPDHIALVYEDVKLSYRELNERSNQLAHYLLQHYQISPDELIPLCLERSEEMLIAILGVLKSGGAYVPMDPNYPMERIEHILGDTKARMVIGEEKTKGRLYEYTSLMGREGESLNIISLNSLEMKGSLSNCSTDNPNTDVSSEDLSYVIYTSGTTGKPKGVMIAHRNVVNLIEQQSVLFSLNTAHSSKRALWYANYVFDAHVWDAYCFLSFGHTLYLINKEIQKDLSTLHRYIAENAIQIASIAPVLLTKELILPLDTLIVAGDITHPDVMECYTREGVDIINGYGPTESTVCTTYHHYNEDHNPLNIGRSISNIITYVLDEYLRPVPVGAVGELYIGGAGLSRGYLNLPELTAERFLENPFQSKEDKERGYSRIYKTGDLVRFLANGEIEYIGRNDFQVKIRGYRIELGEIENSLLSYAGIRQSAVLVKEHNSGFKYFVGYYVSDVAVDHEDLFLYLSGLLPDYMVPSTYVHLEELPMTLNGKLDRRALPEPNFTDDREYIAPETALEKQLAEIYGEVLDLPVESIGLHDDFFRLGGNSIMAIKLISKIHQGLGLQASVAMVFSHKTIFGLAGVLEGLSIDVVEMIHPIEVSHPEDQLLSFAQERLWFIDQYEGGSSAYNIPMVFGLSSKVDLSILKDSFKMLLSRHEILRTLILTSPEGGGYQYVSDEELGIKETYVDSSNQLEDLISQEITRVFDLSKELPISVCVFHKKEKNNNELSSYISIVIHHIAFDGWSIDIFLEELRFIYQDLLTNSSISLPSLRIQYKDFALWQRDYLQGEVLDRQLNYWKTKLSEVEPLNFPLDYTRPSAISYEGHTIRFDISETLGEELRLLSQDLGVSLYNVMLSGYYLLLSSYSGQKDIVLGTVVANRHHAGLEDLIGFFVIP
ncbi:amino acid adenylation domain-containing protein [Chryseobacterium nematophagum]|uniref:Amino acid adenylation domain-containing protein n=1 Tax=Chryseobacterium nematophagum TaxID=2305228 RepID=A0A3M7THC9_9FLAO|nr:non-ribosomal peptide synthetase [Chryseobacterium nematophagum]RNA62698.1 amino acid adenylation domain-containing protein [Chryseobacterium nematophagum]